MDPGPHIACLWQFLLRTPRVLWVCRVPVVSAVGGGLLIASTAQTRDMFADLGLEWWRWLIFLVATFGWAWIVHWAARHALRLDDWVPDAHVPGGIPPARRPQLQAVYRCAAVAWPRLLGTLVFPCHCRDRINPTSRICRSRRPRTGLCSRASPRSVALSSIRVQGTSLATLNTPRRS